MAKGRSRSRPEGGKKTRPARGVAEAQRLAPWIPAVFFLSGFSALVYQVVWQRSLFAIFGINIESVTVVVTVFMLGLGIGSLAGGALSRDLARPLLLYFGLAELGIAAYGVISLRLFEQVGSVTLRMSAYGTGLTTFLLLLVPTMLMGATLPLLVAHAVHIIGNVGRSVSTLYFVNTLGSGVAAILAVLLLMRNLGQHWSVLVAAMGNTIVGLFALVQHFYSRSSR